MAQPTKKTRPVYIDSELHRRLKKMAIDKDIKLQAIVETAIMQFMGPKKAGSQPSA